MARENDSIKKTNEILKNEIVMLQQGMNEQNLVLEAKIESFNKATYEMEKRLSRMEGFIEKIEPQTVYSKL